MKARNASLCVVLFVIAAVIPAQGQVSFGHLSGMVTDPSSAAVSGAKVTLKNVQTGVVTLQISDATGAYRFEVVPAGMYSVTAEAAGFRRFVQENVQMLTGGDVTVNVILQLGALAQEVTVTGVPPALQVTTSTMGQTVRGEMLAELPVLARNPTTLALLNPAAVNDYWDVEHRNPFYMESTGGINMGGDTSGRNSLMLDGIPTDIMSRGSYTPPMDAITEVKLEQNSVDAEYGFNGGGTLNIGMKSGTNDYHGTVYYFGRNPSLNALSDRVSRTSNPVRQNIGGGNVGGPIIKGRLFNFFSFEDWHATQPLSIIDTLPTAAEKTGDFSQTLTPQGTLRVIYDPMSTVFDPITGAVTRTPFPGNKIPPGQFDPTGQMFVNNMWAPNNAGDDASGVNNFRYTAGWYNNYWNLSDRGDFDISSKWRMFARYSVFRTRQDNANYAGNISGHSNSGGIMDALNAGANVIYQPTSNTVLSLTFGVTYDEDDYSSSWSQVKPSEWAKLWPNNPWYDPVLAVMSTGIYYPNVNFSGVGYASAGTGGYYWVNERQWNYNIRLSYVKGMHTLKFGQSMRREYDYIVWPAPGGFTFSSVDTANTFLNPDITQSGDPYASALLGGVNSGNAGIESPYDLNYRQWGAYVQDDIKLTRRLTLNAGLRYEYEPPTWEDSNEFSRYLDLSVPNPNIQASPPNIPASISQYVAGGYKWNGAWIFTDPGHRGLYNANPHIFMPRLGIAFRVNDKTAFRAGWGRYVVPVAMMDEARWYDGQAISGYSRTTPIVSPIEGVPQTFISNPFGAANPLLLPTGKSLGVFQNLGDNGTWWDPNLKNPVSDRFNVTLQRELPFNMMLSATYFFAYERDNLLTSFQNGISGSSFTLTPNMVDPNLIYNTLKSQVDGAVPNPFYQYLTPQLFPGALRNLQTVTMRNLLSSYPQYGTLSELYYPGFASHYKALQLQVERRFTKGLSFTFGYNYNHDSNQNWFNDIAQYADLQQSTPTHTQWFPNWTPRQRIATAGTWELPVGKGRRYLSQLNPVLNAMLGGWQTSHILMWGSGNVLQFGQMIAPTSAPAVHGQRNNWFDTSGFQIAEPYTARTNPWSYPGLYGPHRWDLDSTLEKWFSITERIKLQFRLELYNATNSFVPNDPTMDVTSPNFGKTTDQQNYGRELQYEAQIRF